MNSMTGFGVARGQMGQSRFLVEVRSVNHRFCEVSFRFPGRFASLEPEITRRIRNQFSRGKFDLFLREESLGFDGEEVERARKTLKLLRKIQKELALEGPVGLSDVLAFRGVLYPNVGGGMGDEKARPFLLKLADEALQDLGKMRSREGERLHRWFEKRLKILFRLIDSIGKRASQRGPDYRKRLEKKFKGTGPLEKSRIDQETAIMADKADVTEEIVRLKSHLEEFGRFVSRHEAVGRRFDFLVQEMAREINTIGSKSQGVRLAHEVINFKSELERIREQVQNIE